MDRAEKSGRFIMKICRNCENVFESGSLCPECGGALHDVSEKEENAYNARLKRTVSRQSSRSYGLNSTFSDSVLGSLSLFGTSLQGLRPLRAAKAQTENYVGTYAGAGIVFFLLAAINFLAPKLVRAISSIRLRLTSDEKPTPSAFWVATKNIAKYAYFAFGAMLLLLNLIEIL